MKFVLFLFFIPLLASASTLRVGNGGSGLMKDGKVYLRDLFWNGTQLNENPWFGRDTHPFEDFLLLSLSDDRFDHVRKKVSKKINDLDTAHPGLGFIVGKAILNTNWFFIDYPLGATCDTNEDIIDFEREGYTQVQIANRLRQEVRINQDAWNRMSDEHKAALIVHEALYSIAPTDNREVDCRVPMQATRRFVAWLFKDRPRTEGIEDQLWNYFRLSDIKREKYLPYLYEARGMWMNLVVLEVVKAGQEPVNVSYKEPDFGTTQLSMRTAANKLCIDMNDARAHDFSFTKVLFSATRPPFALIPENDGFRFYNRPYSTLHRVIYENDTGPNGLADWGELRNCENDVWGILQDYFKDF